jgi:hypothetical protein
MPDWRPDWQRAEAYIFADALGLRYSAWEFLRRNSDYQKDWEEALRLFQRAGPEVAQHGFPRVRTLDPSSEHFIIIGSLAAADELRKRWGIQGFVNPEHNRPRQLIFQHPNEIVAIKANAGNDCWRRSEIDPGQRLESDPPQRVLFFPMSVYDSSSPGLWEVCKTARVGGGGRARRGAGSRFASACGNGGPGAAAGGGSGAQRRGRPPLGPRFPSGAAPSIAHACVGWVGAAGRGRRRVARPRRGGGAVARETRTRMPLQATISPRPLPVEYEPLDQVFLACFGCRRDGPRVVRMCAW